LFPATQIRHVRYHQSKCSGEDFGGLGDALGGHGERVYPLKFGSVLVRLPGWEQKSSLVVVDGFGAEPLMLLTTLRAGRCCKRLWRIIESYLTLWRVEETIRFIKQSYHLEDIRLLTYERFRTLATLVMAVAYFACVYLGKRAKLAIPVQHIHRISRRIYGIPEFRFSAVADGIKEVLFGRQGGINRSPPPLPSSTRFQMLLRL